MPSPCSLPRKHRLTKRSEYGDVFKRGRKLVGPAFICYVARGDDACNRMGFSVSRKVGNAVVRNRIKRYLREFFRARRASWPQDMRLVVVARSECAPYGLRQISDALEQQLRGGGFIP